MTMRGLRPSARSRCSRRVRPSSTRCAKKTKVDPYETAIRAAASRDDGLTSQASHQRDRALRKSASQPHLPTTRSAHEESDVEFEEADAEDSQEYGASLSGDIGARTPADIRSEKTRHPRRAGESSPTLAGFSSRLPPPLRTAPPPGRPDIYPGPSNPDAEPTRTPMTSCRCRRAGSARGRTIRRSRSPHPRRLTPAARELRR